MNLILRRCTALTISHMWFLNLARLSLHLALVNYVYATKLKLSFPTANIHSFGLYRERGTTLNDLNIIILLFPLFCPMFLILSTTFICFSLKISYLSFLLLFTLISTTSPFTTFCVERKPTQHQISNGMGDWKRIS